MQEGNRQVRHILWLILAANIAVACVKLALGYISQSASMTADGYHSLTDGVSNIVGLIGISLAAKPIDFDHPYGHRKYECLTGLFISSMLFIISGQIFWDSIERFAGNTRPQITAENLCALLATLVVNMLVCRYELSAGKRLNSFILISDSMHTKSDIYVSVGVLVTLLAIKLGAPAVIDPLASLTICGFILHAAFEICKNTIDVLVDAATVDADLIRSIALSFPEVMDVHKIRSRGSQNDLHLDMHIMISEEMSVGESHKLAHAIEAKLKECISSSLQVMIHIEPYKEQAMGLRRLLR